MREEDADRARLEALRATGLLDSSAEEPFDRLTRLVCRILDVPVALVSLVDADRQFFKSQQGLPRQWAEARQTPLSHSFCQHVVVGAGPLIVEDARTHPLVRDNLAIRDLSVVAYLGFPVRLRNRHVLGSLCAIDSKPRSWTDNDLRTMEDIAFAASGEVDLRDEIARRKESEARYELLSEELAHRIKNLFAVAGSLVTLSASGAVSVEQVVTDLRARIAALARAHDYVWSRNGEARTALPLLGLLRTLLAPYPAGQIAIRGEAQTVGTAAATSISLLVYELATNAAKYGALSTRDGRLDISWVRTADTLNLTWRETGGPAIAADPEAGGFGSRLAERISQVELRADIERAWLPEGLTVALRIPLAAMET